MAKGLWLVGGCYLAARLAGGVIARFGGLLGRNARRKRCLLARLREAQVRASAHLRPPPRPPLCAPRAERWCGGACLQTPCMSPCWRCRLGSR